MKVKTTKIEFVDKSETRSTGGLLFIPEKKIASTLAVFTHGFTSHKASILNWALRLAEEGIPAALFDLPGHYLGSFTEVESFESFQTNAPRMFVHAAELLKKETQSLHADFSPETLILGGHSLGALLSLKAAGLSELQSYQKRQVVAVGFGLPPQGVTHIFNTPFYKSTLAIRAQLVSPALHPDVMFPWIKKEKEELSLKNQNIYLLTGDDDLVVGKDGTERLAEQLEELGNVVTLEKPTKLPHHLPENAAPHIKKFIKDQGFFQS